MQQIVVWSHVVLTLYKGIPVVLGKVLKFSQVPAVQSHEKSEMIGSFFFVYAQNVEVSTTSGLRPLVHYCSCLLQPHHGCNIKLYIWTNDIIISVTKEFLCVLMKSLT